MREHLGEAQLRCTDARGEEILRDMLRHGEASGDTNNVLCARAPEGLVHFAAYELVEVPVVHLRVPSEPFASLWLRQYSKKKCKNESMKES